MQHFKLKIGIHTGKVVGGIIGSKLVRYDIYGPGVLTAYKVMENGLESKITISEDTHRLLNSVAEVSEFFQFTQHKSLKLTKIKQQKMLYTIEKIDEENSDSFGNSHEMSMSNASNDVPLGVPILDESQRSDSQQEEQENPGGFASLIRRQSTHLLKLF